MALLSKPMQVPFRGVMSSSELNAWMEDLHADLSELFARITTQEQQILSQNALWLIQQTYLAAEMAKLRRELEGLQQHGGDYVLYLGADQWTNAETVDGFPRCDIDVDLGIITAHRESITSKLYVRSFKDELVAPKQLAWKLYAYPGVAGDVEFSASNPGDFWTVVQADDLHQALDGRPDTAFFRVAEPGDEALNAWSVLLEITLPSNIVSHRRLNWVAIYPVPAFACDWAYAATSTDGSTFHWLDVSPSGQGSWTDAARQTGPFVLVVPERAATHLRIGMVVRRYLISGGKKLFPYGWRHVDVSYVRFYEGTSKLTLEVPAPQGATSWYLTRDPIPDFHPGSEAMAGHVAFKLTNENGDEITPGPSGELTGKLRLTLELTGEANQAPVLRGVRLHYQISS